MLGTADGGSAYLLMGSATITTTAVGGGNGASLGRQPSVHSPCFACSRNRVGAGSAGDC